MYKGRMYKVKGEGYFFSLLSNGYMEAGLFPFIFDIDFAGSLVVEEHLSEHEFEVIFVHIIARLCYLVVAHVSEIEGGTVAMTRVRDGVDVSAALQVLYVLFGTQYGGDIEAIMREVIAFEDVGPLVTDRVQFAFGRGDEIGDGVGQTIHDIIVIGLDFNETFPHRCGIGSVLGRSGQANPGSDVVLLGLEVVEFDLVAERPSGIGDEVIFGDGLHLRGTGTGNEGKEQPNQSISNNLPIFHIHCTVLSHLLSENVVYLLSSEDEELTVFDEFLIYDFKIQICLVNALIRLAVVRFTIVGLAVIGFTVIRFTIIGFTIIGFGAVGEISH